MTDNEKLIAEARELRVHRDADGDCSHCGTEWEDGHECPPGFMVPSRTLEVALALADALEKAQEREGRQAGKEGCAR